MGCVSGPADDAVPGAFELSLCGADSSCRAGGSGVWQTQAVGPPCNHDCALSADLGRGGFSGEDHSCVFISDDAGVFAPVFWIAALVVSGALFVARRLQAQSRACAAACRAALRFLDSRISELPTPFCTSR